MIAPSRQGGAPPDAVLEPLDARRESELGGAVLGLFSKSMREPVEDGGKQDEAEKMGGELVVAGANAAVTLAPSKAFLDFVPLAAVAAVECGRVAARALEWDAGARALAVSETATMRPRPSVTATSLVFRPSRGLAPSWCSLTCEQSVARNTPVACGAASASNHARSPTAHQRR